MHVKYRELILYVQNTHQELQLHNQLLNVTAKDLLQLTKDPNGGDTLQL